MTPLTADDFAAFFREVNDNCSPFPWQERLAREVFHQGRWPQCLDLPTGSGKTAVLEIALFHLALEARSLAARRAPVRMAFVVDRRLIVDQAHEHARGIHERLVPGGETVAARVATELQFLAGANNTPLVLRALRGGLPYEPDWAQTPVQPTILFSTVDQVGSRLLFRGYGISKSMRPIHAGLLGSDCLIFLDEAHLSEPFRQSLEWIAMYRGSGWTEKTPGAWGVVTLSATPNEGVEGAEPFRLSEADKVREVLGRRIRAKKPAELHELKSTKTAEDYAQLARKLAGEQNIERILIVVNRVDLARAIFGQFEAGEAVLLTGRVREIEREEIVSELGKKLRETGRTFFAVATQCVEAGADFDFDGLVTQIAPIDSLRQRFGRLNRRGLNISSRAVIAATKEDLRLKKPDPVYGFAASKAWDLLKRIARSEDERTVVDFGSLALDEVLKSEARERIQEACSEKLDAPVMPPAYVALWACTNPPPTIEPDVALFLHGAERATADVEIVWRGDMVSEDLGDQLKVEKLVEILTLVPPRPAETLAIPIWKVRAWLAGSPNAARFGDLEGEREPEDSGVEGRQRVLRWFGADDERTLAIWSSEIRPGDVIVVPASYGGCDRWGWTGRGEGVVSDLALGSAARLRSPKIGVRFHPRLVAEVAWDAIAGLLAELSDDPRRLREELQDSNSVPEEWRKELEQIVRGSEEITTYVEDRPDLGLVLTGRREKANRKFDQPCTEGELGNFGDDSSSLAVHSRKVTAKTKDFSERAGLNEPVRRALEFAAQMHDSGKGDRRFQFYLRNGSDGGEILAKSKRRVIPAIERRIRLDSRLPDRWRHEALSVRVAMGDSRFTADDSSMDSELALWLIGTHHGWGRPFFPHDDCLDDCGRDIGGENGEAVRLPAMPGPQRLDFDWNGLDWASLFDRLHRRYGPWELARLESFIRLADHRASEEG